MIFQNICDIIILLFMHADLQINSVLSAKGIVFQFLFWEGKNE